MSFVTRCWWKAARRGRLRRSCGFPGAQYADTSPKPFRHVKRRSLAGGRYGTRFGSALTGCSPKLLAQSVQWTAGKQRLTATRLHELLVAEGHRVGVTLVKEAVAEWKRQRREVSVPLTYRPGDLADVDFFEVLVDLDGTRAQGVALSDAADVIRPRLRLDLRAPGPVQLPRWTRPGLHAFRRRAGACRRRRGHYRLRFGPDRLGCNSCDSKPEAETSTPDSTSRSAWPHRPGRPRR